MIGLTLWLVQHALAVPMPPGASDVGTPQVWSTTAFEVRPDLTGQNLDRYAERLGVDVPLGKGWRVGLIGGFRSLSLPETPLELDVWRGVIEHRADDYRVAVGRLVRNDPRGLLRLDGISLDLRDDSFVRWSFWGGRRWHPDVPDSLDFLVAGAELKFGKGPRSQLSVGVEGRDELDQFVQRVWAAGEIRDIVGHRLGLLLEAQSRVRESDFRGSLDGTLVAGRYLDLGLNVRWEGMPPATALDDPRSPILWLAPDGYGIGAVSARWNRGKWSWVASGGPVVRRDSDLDSWATGGRGRAALVWRPTRTLTLQTFGMAAGIDQAALAGGGAGLGLEGSDSMVDATAAVWSIRPIDGDVAPVAEGRLTALGKVLDRTRGQVRSQIFLGARGSAGADRQLQPFFFGGGQLTVRFLRGDS